MTYHPVTDITVTGLRDAVRDLLDTPAGCRRQVWARAKAGGRVDVWASSPLTDHITIARIPSPRETCLGCWTADKPRTGDDGKKESHSDSIRRAIDNAILEGTIDTEF